MVGKRFEEMVFGLLLSRSEVLDIALSADVVFEDRWFAIKSAVALASFIGVNPEGIHSSQLVLLFPPFPPTPVDEIETRVQTTASMSVEMRG